MNAFRFFVFIVFALVSGMTSSAFADCFSVSTSSFASVPADSMPDSWEDYDLVFQVDDKGISDPGTVFIAVKWGNDWMHIPLSDHMENNGVVKVTWREIGVRSGDEIRFSTFDSRNSVKSLLKCDINKLNLSNLDYFFMDCPDLESADALTMWNTSEVVSMRGIFINCYSLKSLDLSNFDTGNVKNMGGMFMNCHSLSSVDLSNFDTRNVTDMYEMFYRCYKLSSLDLSSFRTSNVRTFDSMFYNCNSLESLNLSNWDFSNANFNRYCTTDYLFCNASKLSTIIGPVSGVDSTLVLHAPLSGESAGLFIDALKATESPKSIVFSKQTFEQLTEEQLSIVSEKGWSVASL